MSISADVSSLWRQILEEHLMAIQARDTQNAILWNLLHSDGIQHISWDADVPDYLKLPEGL